MMQNVRIRTKPGYLDFSKPQYVVDKKYFGFLWIEVVELCSSLEEATKYAKMYLNPYKGKIVKIYESEDTKP